MSIIHRTVFGRSGTVSPFSPPPTPSLFSATPTTGVSFIDVPILTSAFGPLPTKFGVATESDGFIVIDTSALEGIIDCGDYP